jgi:hypothetical protein
MDVIKVLKIQIYSIVVCKVTGCTWNTGNISLAQLEKEDLEKKG